MMMLVVMLVLMMMILLTMLEVMLVMMMVIMMMMMMMMMMMILMLIMMTMNTELSPTSRLFVESLMTIIMIMLIQNNGNNIMIVSKTRSSYRWLQDCVIAKVISAQPTCIVLTQPLPLYFTHLLNAVMGNLSMATTKRCGLENDKRHRIYSLGSKRTCWKFLLYATLAILAIKPVLWPEFNTFPT